MTWTYRVRKKAITGTKVGYGLVEVYSSANGESCTDCTVPTSIMKPGDPLSDAKALDDLRWQLTEMLKALDKPILGD